MSRFLYIGPDHPTAGGGREQLARLHRAVLGELRGDKFDAILLSRTPLGGAAALRAALSGRIDGTGLAAEKRILAHIAGNDIGQVWLDGSNLGVLAKAIKRRFPSVEIFTFFHNIEPRFFLGAFRQQPSLRAAGVLAASFVAERKAVRFSDRLVVLNARDGDVLHRLHRRRASDLLPMAINQAASGIGLDSAAPVDGDYLLFVGGAFYANQAGISWYAEHVAPRIALPTYVVGRGREPLRGALERTPNVHLVGEVDALGPWYHHAKAVVAPIFDGSGMKTKVAEAWMHGKRVIGTREAFTGYGEVTNALGWQCETADQFVLALKQIEGKSLPRIDPSLRLRFEELYSYEAARARLATMLGSPDR